MKHRSNKTKNLILILIVLIVAILSLFILTSLANVLKINLTTYADILKIS